MTSIVHRPPARLWFAFAAAVVLFSGVASPAVHAEGRGHALVARTRAIGARARSGVRRVGQISRAVAHSALERETWARTSVGVGGGLKVLLPVERFIPIPASLAFLGLDRLVTFGPWAALWSGNFRQWRRWARDRTPLEAPLLSFGGNLANLTYSSVGGRGFAGGLPWLSASVSERSAFVRVGHPLVASIGMGKLNRTDLVNRDAPYLSFSLGSGTLTTVLGLPIIFGGSLDVYSPMIEPIWQSVGEPAARWVQGLLARDPNKPTIRARIATGARRVRDRVRDVVRRPEPRDTTENAGEARN